MKHPLLIVATAVCLSSPALLAAQTIECPQPPEVFKAADAGTDNLQALSQTVGTAELDGESLKKVAAQVRSDYPDASDAEVADIMITAFCNYLNTDAPADHRSEDNVAAFESQTYEAVFGGGAPDDYTRHGWLYGN